MSAQPSKFRKRLLTVVVLLLLVGGAVTAYMMGVPIPGLKQTKAEPPKAGPAARLKVELVKDVPHALTVPEEVRASLGIRKKGKDIVAIAEEPKGNRLLTLSASTAFDPAKIYRIRIRFTPADVIELKKLSVPSEAGTRERELAPGDEVKKGTLLAELYSVDLGSRKSDLLDALVNLNSDKEVLKNAEASSAAPAPLILQFKNKVETDISNINRALRYLQAWKIPKEEVDEVYKEADNIFNDKTRRELRLPKKYDPDEKDRWGRVFLKAPADAIIVEMNAHEGETLLDPTLNVFQLANVDKMLIYASAPEELVKELYQIWREHGLRWTIRTLGEPDSEGISSPITEIGYITDPNTHVIPIKGLIPNKDRILRSGQFVTATIELPPPKGVVEIPASAIVDDGKQTVVFVQPDANKPEYVLRRVLVTHRFKNRAVVKMSLTDKERELTPEEEEAGMMPKQPLVLGDRVITAGLLELKKELEDRESDRAE